MLTDIRYVKLETKNNCLIGNINKILATRNGFVVADYYISNSIFFFDKTGRFINKVALKGSGRSIKSLKDIAYNYDNNTVYIYDNIGSAIYCYDENGTYLNRYPVKNIYFRRIAYLGDSLLLFYHPSLKERGGLNNYELCIGDVSGNIKYKAFERKQESGDGFDYNFSITTEGSDVYYSRRFSKYIYKIAKDSLAIFPGIRLDFPENKSVIDKVTESTTLPELKLLLSADNYNFDGEILSVNNVLYTGIYKKSMNMGVFYSEKNGRIAGGHLVSRLSINDTANAEYYSYPIASSNNEFISVMNPDVIVKSEQNFERSRKAMHIPVPHRERQLDAIMSTMRVDDNPVLVLYKIKPF